MRVAICNWTGTGNGYIDPFRPDATLDGLTYGVFDLRGKGLPGRVADGRCIVFCPDATAAIPGALRDLGDDWGITLPPGIIRAIENDLGITLDNVDIRRILRQVMLNGGPAGKWDAIKPGHDRWYRGVMAGVEVFRVPQVGGGAVAVSDDFNRTDADAINTGAPFTWSEINGDVDIVSNKAVPQTIDNVARGRCDVDTDTVDQYAQITVRFTNTTSGLYWGLGVRVSAIENDWVEVSGAADDAEGLKLYNVNNDSTSTIGSFQNVVTDPDTDMVYKITVDGSTITGWKDGTSYSQTDSTTDGVTQGGKRAYFGSYIAAGQTAGNLMFDDFSFGDIVTENPADLVLMTRPPIRFLTRG